MEEILYVEKYRPHKIEDCILPDRMKNSFKEYVINKKIPNLMLTGPAGCGKTTVARALCEEVGCEYLFINSSEERGIDTLRTKIKSYASTIPLVGGRKVIILDESDYITPEAQAALRGAIEEFSHVCSFIFTCNFKARLISALHSRCSVIDFTLSNNEKPKMASQMLKRLEQIMKEENIQYDKKVLVKIVERYFPDYRRTLNELQRYCVSGNIDVSIIPQLENVHRFGDLMKSLKEKDFTSMRKWVVTNSDIDIGRIYKTIYDELYEYLKEESIPLAVIILAKYDYQSAFVSNQELNLVACLTELMVDCEIK